MDLILPSSRTTRQSHTGSSNRPQSLQKKGADAPSCDNLWVLLELVFLEPVRGQGYESSVPLKFVYNRHCFITISLIF